MKQCRARILNGCDKINSMFVYGVSRVVVVAAMMFAGQTAQAQKAESGKGDNSFNAVVKLEVTTAKTNIRSPWKKEENMGSGSGVVVGDGRILTCAHCVADATFIRIRKNDEESIYQGEVEYVSHSCDLALVRVKDPKFMLGVTCAAIGDTPSMQTQVLAVGFPLGGNGISFTQGIVSRVEAVTYSHSLEDHLAIQVDAAINPGNSGGPVFDLRDGRIAGIAFQGNKKGESLGYLIPPDVIRHFLKDVEDGHVDGFAIAPFKVVLLENSEARRHLKMTGGRTGCLVVDVQPSLGTNSLMRGDILLSICGYAVANNGYIRIAGNERRDYRYPLDNLQIGEKYPVKVLRNGTEKTFTLTAKPRNQRIRPFMHDRLVDYYVFGGYVFTTVSYDLLALRPSFNFEPLGDEKRSPDDEPVVLVDVMADESTEGYLGLSGTLVQTVNGTEVRNIRQLIRIIEDCRDEFLCLELDRDDRYSTPVYLNREQQKNATKRVLEKYAIPVDRSKDLQ